jgi:hypothetical protein
VRRNDDKIKIYFKIKKFTTAKCTARVFRQSHTATENGWTEKTELD